MYMMIEIHVSLLGSLRLYHARQLVKTIYHRRRTAAYVSSLMNGTGKVSIIFMYEGAGTK